MKSISLINDLKDLVNDIRQEESIARSAGNELHCSGLAQARVLLELRLEKHGISRITTLENASKI